MRRRLASWLRSLADRVEPSGRIDSVGVYYRVDDTPWFGVPFAERVERFEGSSWTEVPDVQWVEWTETP